MTNTGWQARPVFISSTFADMQSERDALRSVVFPDLEARFRTRCQHLEWIDLRIGASPGPRSDPSAREALILKVCFDEVRRSRPFLIALIGDRYGSVPPAQGIEHAAAEAGLREDVSGRSLTDLEIAFSAFGTPDQDQRSIFLLRRPLPYDKMGAEAGIYSDKHANDSATVSRAERLVALKGRIVANCTDRVLWYDASWNEVERQVVLDKGWGQTVADFVWRIATTGHPQLSASTQTWEQAERAALEEFIEVSRRDFRGRAELLTGLRAFLLDETHTSCSGRCLVANPGIGKSTLFSELATSLAEEPVLVLRHSASASPRGASVDAMLARWSGEIAAALNIANPLEDSSQKSNVEETFVRLLGRAAANQRVILLCDALDKFEATPRGRHLTWLPKLWPTNVRWFSTTRPGPWADTLRRRLRFEVDELPPLTESEARVLVEAVYTRYHRKPDDQLISVLLVHSRNAPSSLGNPLWLTMAAEDLNLVDGDDVATAERGAQKTMDARISAYLSERAASYQPDVAGLAIRAFRRGFTLFGESFGTCLIIMLTAGRIGWRESDLREVIPSLTGVTWDSLQFAMIRRYLRGQLRPVNKLRRWTFVHEDVRIGAQRFCDEEHVDLLAMHARLAAHLRDLPADDPLHISETVFHAVSGGLFDMAAEYLARTDLSESEINGGTRALIDVLLKLGSSDANVCIKGLFRAAERPGVAQSFLARMVNVVDPSLEQRGAVEVRLQVMKSILSLAEGPSVGTSAKTRLYRAIATSLMGDILRSAGDQGEAERCHRTALEMFRDLDPRSMDPHIQSEQLKTLEMLSDVLDNKGDVRGALSCLQQVLTVSSSLGTKPADAALLLSKIGYAQLAVGDRSAASAASLRALEVLGFDEGSADVLTRRTQVVCLMQAADCAAAIGNREQAANNYEQALQQAQSLSDTDPDDSHRLHDLSVAQDRAGNFYRMMGDLRRALVVQQDGLGIAQRLVMLDSANMHFRRDLAGSHVRLAEVFLAAGRCREAFRECHQAIKLLRSLCALDGLHLQWKHSLAVSIERAADIVNARMTHPRIARALYEQSLPLFDEVYAKDSVGVSSRRGTATIHGKIGSTLLMTGEIERGVRELEMSVDVDTHGDPQWTRDVGVSYQRLGDACMMQNKPEEALVQYRRSLRLFQRLQEDDPDGEFCAEAVIVTQHRLELAKEEMNGQKS